MIIEEKMKELRKDVESYKHITRQIMVYGVKHDGRYDRLSVTYEFIYRNGEDYCLKRWLREVAMESFRDNAKIPFRVGKNKCTILIRNSRTRIVERG